ncbi:hypothetical protein HDU97_009140 [Phlyctochytrium planicorne]|nr:hypothetical protein HDU97_009140 [Phlyctochytrium planicorne]
MTVQVVPVPVLEDNYAYLLLTDPTAKQCAAVDPAEADKVLAKAQELGWEIKSILTTHHHHDHAGGNEDLVKLVGSPLTVYGGDDRIGALNLKVEDGKGFKLGALDVKPLYTICHTTGSVSYYIVNPETGKKVVFTGDTLFIGGCGRFFEGTPEQMHNSLNKVLGSLPDDTEVYCGHEYTSSNLRFAAHIEPTNTAITSKLQWCASNPVSVPSTIGAEKTFNPFMRVHVEDVVKATGKTGDVEVMGALRELKNGFRG